MIYKFNDVEINTDTFELNVQNKQLSVEPKVFDLILYLVKHRERLISRDELFKEVWQGRDVSDTSLSNHIKTARKLLCDSSELQHVIKTIRGRGYQFIATVIEEPSERIQPVTSLFNKLFYQVMVVLLAVCLVVYFYFTVMNTNDDAFNGVGLRKKIAVLPLQNIKPNDGNDYLGFAITDQVIGRLMNVNQLMVRSSSAIASYQHTVVNIETIGETLNVDYVVNGSYLKENDTIRLTIELVNVSNGQLVWRKSLTEAFENIFHIQDVVANHIVKHFSVRFSQTAMAGLTHEKPSNLLAYNQYLRALALPLTNEGANSAVVLLKKSISTDPNFSSYYVALADRLKFLGVFELKGNSQKEKAIGLYRKALLINPESRLAMMGLVSSYVEQGDTAQAIELAIKLVTLNPQYAQAHYTLGYIYRYAGMLDESIKEMELAINMNPQDYWSHNLGVSYLSLGQYEQALNKLSVGENTPYSLGWMGSIHLYQHNHEQALSVLNKVIEMEPNSFWGLDSVASRSIITQNKEEGIRALTTLEAANLVDPEPLFYWAGIYAMLGDIKGALRLLTLSVDNGYFNYPYFVNNPFLDPVRHLPEFQNTLNKVKLKHDNFSAKYSSK